LEGVLGSGQAFLEVSHDRSTRLIRKIVANHLLFSKCHIIQKFTLWIGVVQSILSFASHGPMPKAETILTPKDQSQWSK
jgi:hypothetical protein